MVNQITIKITKTQVSVCQVSTPKIVAFYHESTQKQDNDRHISDVQK